MEVETTENAASGFLSLPCELRDQIYELIVIKPHATITMLNNHNCHKSEISACQPAISKVNHELRMGSLAMFYSLNVFLAEVSNRDDLAIAKRWLAGIGDVNAGHVRRLALCGWTKVPFGHMMCRRWMKVVFDLKHGTMEVNGNHAPGQPTVAESEHPQIVRGMEELRKSFNTMVAIRAGKRFDVMSLTNLMEGFHLLCVYW